MGIRANAKRRYGSGSIIEKNGAYFGKWRIGDRQVMRKLGQVRMPTTRDGLTRTMAEAKLRKVMAEVTNAPVAERITVEEAGRRLIDHLEALGRKPSTIGTYRSLLGTHLADLGQLDRVTPDRIETMIATMRRAGSGPKVTVNALTLLSQVFEHGIRRGWCAQNPCKLVDRPRVEQGEEIRCLDEVELEALLRATPNLTDRTMFLVAAMTGLRQGELLALQWQDVDWTAARVRVRRNYVRGHWGTPKSRRSTRAVPMADGVAAELERHFQRSHYQDDEDLVFGDSDRGTVQDHSGLVRRYKAALRRAGVREVRFHDLRHTFGTRMAGANVPMRTLQEWMGHRSIATTERYADYAPSTHEAEMVARAFGSSTYSSTNLSTSETNSDHLEPL